MQLILGYIIWHYVSLQGIFTFQRMVATDARVVDLSYNHYDQISCFSNLQYYIKVMLENLCRDKIVSFGFKQLKTDTLVCDFDGYTPKNNVDYYIKLTSDTFKNNNLVALSEIRIAPSEHLELIIQHALPGIDFTVMDVVTSDLQVRENIIWLQNR